jgi:hypothetical protein
MFNSTNQHSIKKLGLAAAASLQLAKQQRNHTWQSSSVHYSWQNNHKPIALGLAAA